MATKLAPIWYEGKTAVILDASSAMGRACTEALARRGTHLVLVTRSVEPLRDWATMLTRVNAVQVDLVCADPRQAKVVQQVCATVEQADQRVALLLTSDGGEPPGRWEVRRNVHPPQGRGSPVVLHGRASSPMRLATQALRAVDQGHRQVVLELAARPRTRRAPFRIHLPRIAGWALRLLLPHQGVLP